LIWICLSLLPLKWKENGWVFCTLSLQEDTT
jgi:hypothetical protein